MSAIPSATQSLSLKRKGAELDADAYDNELKNGDAAMNAKEVDLLNAYWRASNYLSVGQIYLLSNPLLRVPPAGGARQAPSSRALGKGVNITEEVIHLLSLIEEWYSVVVRFVVCCKPLQLRSTSQVEGLN